MDSSNPSLKIKDILSVRSKLGRFICSLLYCITYEFIFNHFTYATFKYMGVEHREFSIQLYLLYLFCSAFPFIFYKGLQSIASGFSLMLYILAYIPIMESIFSTEKMVYESRVIYCIVFFSLMCIFFISDSWKLGKRFFTHIKLYIPRQFLFNISIILLLLLLVLNFGQMRFVNIITQRELMYELREDLSENMFPGSGYIIFWLSNAFLPVLLIYALRVRNWKNYLLIIGGYTILFMVTMQKSTFLMPFILTFAYRFAVKYSDKITNYAHSFIFLMLILISAILYLTQSYNIIIFGIAAVFFYRTMCVSGHLFSMYIHFFEHNPETYYSHISIVNSIFHNYPYKDVLGRVVSDGAMNANATFLITDGIAAMGVIGVIFIGIAFILLKSFLNSIELKYNKTVSLIAFLPGILSFLNVSLFTSMITGGLLVLYFIFRNTKLPALQN